MTKLSEEIQRKLETYIKGKLEKVEYYGDFEIWIKQSDHNYKYITTGNYVEIIEHFKEQCLHFLIDGQSYTYRVLGIEFNNISGVEFDLLDL